MSPWQSHCPSPPPLPPWLRPRLASASLPNLSGNKIANLTFYDIKSAWTQAKNYALNISEIEAKVNEATNDDPWGASSTLMQEIAGATHNFQDFNEIMPCIFRNFMEREAREWRQIYKSLQLLEYITKHGSERVVDDARAHLGTIKILRNFHYIDEAGKDQGLNVRNRAKELADLLSDVDRIRQERRKARSNRQKYQGVSNSDFVPGSGQGRYGGFSSESYHAGGVGGSSSGGGGGGGEGARESFDEYDAGDDEDGAAASKPPPSARASTSSRRTGSAPAPPSKGKKQAEAKVADLFSFDDEEAAAPAAPAASGSGDAFGDDFDDFQAAPSGSGKAPAATPAAPAAKAPAASSNGNKGGNNVFDFLGGDDFGSAPSAAPQQQRAQPSSALSPPMRPAMSSNPSASSLGGSSVLSPQQRSSTASSATSASTASKPSGGLSGFDDLWSSSNSGSSTRAGATGKKTMADLAKEQSGMGVWGGGGSKPPMGGQAGGASQKKQDLFDLL
ncbi:ENTH-domain-containing protein [Jaminaea rosea]|uniref:ENTH-domain-containing protein n=1 Tax=Jaminaea rosea TaxID=1569628 RepID=A0A316V2L8_9BASI|nr:ENTH-domain-containing protein [Jaminaea rosea]PWN30423.1 ENTH-domain-containing protein [Jaminaea rosea]